MSSTPYDESDVQNEKDNFGNTWAATS